jgi:hypothetical protein
VKALQTCLLALVAGAAIWGAVAAAGGTTPASAQLPPGWTPGTFYRNVSNSPSANPIKNPMPSSKPTDPQVQPDSGESPVASWSFDGFRAQPPSPFTVNSIGQYCTDASGGMVWVATGAPSDQLTCPDEIGRASCRERVY